MRRRLFESFKKRIKGLFGQPMDLIDDIDFVSSGNRTVAHILAQFTDIVNASIGSGIDLENIRRRAQSDLFANSTDSAWFRGRPFLAVESTSQNPGGGSFAGAAWPAE